MGYNPSSFSGKPYNPVEQVSWLEARDFCDKFSDKYGVTARLPLEAEWEYAARGGAQTKYFWGDDADLKLLISMRCMKRTVLIKVKRIPIWYSKSRSKAPNGFGLYDMTACL
jgi:formylglycine-generating enzyme required for sulfatase activity